MNGCSIIISNKLKKRYLGVRHPFQRSPERPLAPNSDINCGLCSEYHSCMDGVRAKKSCGVFGGPELEVAGLLSLLIGRAFCFKGSLRVGKGLCNSPLH